MKPLNLNTGVLFENKRGRGPTFVGRICIDRDLVDAIWQGKELELVAWENDSEKGVWYSLRINGPRDDQ